MTKEERVAIRARYEAAANRGWDWGKWPDGIRQIYRQDVPALLAALEEAEFSLARASDQMKHIQADRDRWKARAEALEGTL